MRDCYPKPSARALVCRFTLGEHGWRYCWTRPAFPKSLSGKSCEDANTFQTSALLLWIGVRLAQSNATSVVYWRPCLLKSDHRGVIKLQVRFIRQRVFLPIIEPSQEGEQVSEVASDNLLSESYKKLYPFSLIC